MALGRKAWLFAGFDRGGDRAAFMYSLIATAKLNDIDPQAWLADVLARIADMPQARLGELFPLELAADRHHTGTCPSRLMASPTFTWTARFVAEQLGAAEDLVEEIASMAMEPEDGRISIIDSNEDDAPFIAAFTRDGIDYLRETLSDPSSRYYSLSPRH